MNTSSTIRDEWEASVKTCTTRALARYPEETARILRGMAIVMEAGVHVTTEGVRVDSQTHEGRQYPVNGTCACYDASRAPEGRCKHRWAKALYTRAAQPAPAPQRRCFYCNAPEGSPLAETGPCCVAHLWYTFPQPAPAPQRLHYYATYYPDDQRLPSLQGTAIEEEGHYTFVGDDGQILLHASLARLVLGGRMDLIQAQQDVDGESLGAKFGQPQYPQY